MLFGIITGRTRIALSGAFALSFVGTIMKTYAVRQIESKDKFCCEITVRRRDVNQIQHQARQVGLKTEIIENAGLVFLFDRIFKRKGLILGLVFFFVTVYVSSLFIWDINVIGNEKISDEEIKKGLERVGLCEGVLKSRIDPGSVRNRYIIGDNRISWMSVILYGTCANVEVIESEIPPPRQDKAPISNIVAKRDGIIERVDALNGQSVVEKGQTVSKGELLVSAVITTRKENELLTGARANVFARTQRRFVVGTKLSEYKKKYTQNSVNRYTLEIVGRSIILPCFKRMDNGAFDYESKTIRPKVFGIIELPFTIKAETFKEYKIQEQKVSKEEAKEKVEAKLEDLLKKELGSAPILEKNIDFKVENGYAQISCYIECIENIAKASPVTFSS